MASGSDSRDGPVEGGAISLDIGNVQKLLQVKQEQIQKRTFTNWVNAQLSKRKPPCEVQDLFNDFCDGSRLLDLLEVMSGQQMGRERGRTVHHQMSNIETALAFLEKKSIKLVNINTPDIINGKPSIILGLIWTIIRRYHIEELASSLSFSSRQSSLANLDSRSTSTLSSPSASSGSLPPRSSPLHSHSASSSCLPPRSSPLHRHPADKALLHWVREQCHKAGCTLNVKDFKASWRSGIAFLAILNALRPDLVDLSKASSRSNKQNLEEAFCTAERELRIPRLLEPDDVDVPDPDEKSMMMYVAQFLQYSRDLPVPEKDMQSQPKAVDAGSSEIRERDNTSENMSSDTSSTVPAPGETGSMDEDSSTNKENIELKAVDAESSEMTDSVGEDDNTTTENKSPDTSSTVPAPSETGSFEEVSINNTSEVGQGQQSAKISEKIRPEEFYELLCKLHLNDNYLDKLTTADIMQIGSSIKKPNEITEKDLVHTFLLKLLMLDHRARYIPVENNVKVTRDSDKGSTEESFFDVFDRTNVNTDQSMKQCHINPMDVQMAVFHCSDSFLRQNIITKLSQCQYALPLLVPDPVTMDIQCPLWTFRQIRKTWKVTDMYSGTITSKDLPICQAETSLVNPPSGNLNSISFQE